MSSYTTLDAQTAKIGQEMALLPNQETTDRISASEPLNTSIGIPKEKPYLSTTDCLTVLLVLLCLVASIACVEIQNVAYHLQQTNQLVLIGLLLSLMAFCLQRQIRLLLIVLEARYGRSTIQNYNAVLTTDMFSPHLSLWIRISLMILFVLPLALSASYKQFIGGLSTFQRASGTGIIYGLTGPTGVEDYGYGLSLFTNATNPISQDMFVGPVDPKQNRTYGFNMAILSENQTALLDGPLSSYLTTVRDELGAGESTRLTAPVKAIVASLNSSRGQIDDENFWANVSRRLGTYGEVNLWDESSPGLSLGLLTNAWDSSLLYISLYGVNQTNLTQAIGMNVYRSRCFGTWIITRTTVLLDAAWDCERIDSVEEQALIAWSDQSLDQLYLRPLTEYLNYPTIVNRTDLSDQAVNSLFISVGAAMIWSRTTLLNGFSTQNRHTNQDGPSLFTGVVYNTTDIVHSTVPTLKRSGTLVLVLCLQPALMVAALLMRVLLYSTPVGEGFGLVSLIAGVSHSSQNILKGAAYSGSLSQTINVHISVDHEGKPMEQQGLVKYTLATYSRGFQGAFRRKWKYA